MVGALVVATVALQIAYPLTHGAARDRLTISIVLLAAAASAAHATRTRGRRGVACWCAAAIIGFGAEVAGVHTGVPFGTYRYSATLGVRVAGVPLVAAAAWAMLAWPAALVARRLVAHRLASTTLARVLVGGWALASWDLFADPQLVAAGAWRWTAAGPQLPGVPGVPLTNYAGWLLIATLISAAVQPILGDARSAQSDRADRPDRADRADRAVDDHWMLALYLWTWASSIVGLAVFLHLPAAALWGGLGMGLVAVPVLVPLLTTTMLTAAATRTPQARSLRTWSRMPRSLVRRCW